ncbi:hypothetical protein J2W30_003656 [Variovorax boronicumulans]|uniref:hypothetical protein n=1 Tax=Variovorax boronicumulans TaxID=436515 RepID=UPI002780958C|nr:hypothetical protein [Variovorax boronicumulans]MDQ0035883.1 hypothetical protein [Variovorax boronicumulans]
MRTNSSGETISLHDQGEDLPRMGGETAQRDVVAIVKAGGYVSDVEWECANSSPCNRTASTHTLGPWEVSGTSVIAPDGGTICSTATFARPNAEDEANAVLIAKAPDMFEALEAIEFALSQGMPAAMVLDENSPIRDCIRAAVAAVKGATP